MDKTEADVNGKISKQIQIKSGFKWPKHGFKYLGIFIPSSLDQLYDTNYKKVIKNISEDLNRWTALPLSLIGRVESIRMNVLPRLLYLFQMLPKDVPKSVFDLLNKIISKFVWQGKRPRIRLKIIQSSKTNGGLGLPNFRFYFWAAQLRPLVSWMRKDTQTRWINIEKSLCSMPLKIVPFSSVSLKNASMGQWTIQRSFGLSKKISSAASIGYLNDFAPSRTDVGFKKWSQYGLNYLHQLFHDDTLKSFEQIRN